MKTMMFYSFKQLFRVLALVALIVSGFAACTPKYLSPGTLVSDKLAPQINPANAWTVATTQRAGTIITVELQFWSATPVQDLFLGQIVTRTTSGVVARDTSLSRVPNRAAYSREKQCDTILLSYTVPVFTRSTGQTIQVNPFAALQLPNDTTFIKPRYFFNSGNGFTWNP
jgi:hypothetical protein